MLSGQSVRLLPQEPGSLEPVLSGQSVRLLPQEPVSMEPVSSELSEH